MRETSLEKSYYANTGIRKAILLTRCVNLWKAWISRYYGEGTHELDNGSRVARKIDPVLKTQFQKLLHHFRSEMVQVNDQTIEKVTFILQQSYI